MRTIDLPYYADTWIYLSALQEATGLIWHHEGPESLTSEWLSAWPEIDFVYRGSEITEVYKADSGSSHSQSKGNFTDVLRQHMPELLGHSKIKFSGGLAGHLSYDYGLELLAIDSQHKETEIPIATVGLYSWSLGINHKHKSATIYIQPFCSESVLSQIKNFAKATKDLHRQQDFSISDWQCRLNKDQYAVRFKKLQDYIINGDCYQVNLTRQWYAQLLHGNDLGLYSQLTGSMPAPFSVFHRTRTHSLLSVSPERFIKVSDSKITTQPIKGTRPRSTNLEQDEALKVELYHSEKDRAENLMIVDLLRNDIAKNAQPGSVQVDKLFEIQSFKNVHHLVSTITAKLLKGRDPLHLLADAFPGGSITGAPKKRAMEIIDELETCRRGNYCGCSFYLGANNEFDSNILIRSMTLQGKELTCSGGGGVVFDSQVDAEFEESDVKVRRMLTALE